MTKKKYGRHNYWYVSKGVNPGLTMTMNMIHRHSKGHFHHALPICSLPPEDTSQQLQSMRAQPQIPWSTQGMPQNSSKGSITAPLWYTQMAKGQRRQLNGLQPSTQHQPTQQQLWSSSYCQSTSMAPGTSSPSQAITRQIAHSYWRVQPHPNPLLFCPLPSIISSQQPKRFTASDQSQEPFHPKG